MGSKRDRHRRKAERIKRLAALATSTHRLKLERAGKHIDDAVAVLDAWRERSVRLTTEKDEHGNLELYAEMTENLDVVASLIVGDAIQCLRQSLDHIVFALAERNNPDGMTVEQQRDVQWPFRDTPYVSAPGGLAVVSQAVQQLIVTKSPGGTPADFHSEPLWFLNQLSNRDKHRAIPIVVSTMGSRDIRPIGDGGVVDVVELDGYNLEIGKKARVAMMGPGAQGKVQVSVVPVMLFGLETELPHHRVLEALVDWHAVIENDVFPMLEPHLL